jgi:NAD(P)-dependent dehydrogenase (short-subunit alcohol dehydrogenase family)
MTVANLIKRELSMNAAEKIRPLEHQTALVTHATSGIGAAIAEALADAGAKVMINYLHEREKAEQLAEHIRNKQGQTMIFRADVTQENEVNSMLDVLAVYWGRMDILVDNTGLQEKSLEQFESTESKRENISRNLAMQFLRVRQARRFLVGQGVNTLSSIVAGKLICISTPDLYSKNALNKLLHTLTQEVSVENIRVNAIMAKKSKPYTLNNGSILADEADSNAYAIAKMAVWLVSDEADYSNGEIFNSTLDIQTDGPSGVDGFFMPGKFLKNPKK